MIFSTGSESCIVNVLFFSAQFTSPELLTGPNKWACDKCTRLAQEMTPESDSDPDRSAGAKPKTVYSNASKQLLIFCPPAVLTIHLKRFQQTMFNLRKVNKHVTFPVNLDLAPFCSSTSLRWIKVFIVKILFDARCKTLDLPLSNGCRDWLFKAYFSALKRPSQANDTDWKKGKLIQKLTYTYVSTL